MARLALDDIGGTRDIMHLAELAATSPRTISRAFPAETGLTFKRWRQRARVVSAMDGLSAGLSILQVAARTGFSSTAAFSQSFRQVTGMTASQFLDTQAGVV